MNEQLQKIAEDAGVDARTMGFESNQHHRDPWNARLEKFAELIIQECYESCKSQVLDKETADTNELTYNDAVGDCAIGLLQHFGMME